MGCGLALYSAGGAPSSAVQAMAFNADLSPPSSTVNTAMGR